jgi:voltage-gated potassium channel
MRQRGFDAALERSPLLRPLSRAALLLVGVVAAGTVGYIVLEHWSFLDALYMTVITVASIGFEEVHSLDNDPTGRVWTMIVAITGLGTVAYALSSIVAMVVEGNLSGYFRRRRMEQAIRKLSGHFILCGYGRVGREVAAEFREEGVDFVIVDQDEASLRECEELGYLVVLGDAADDGVLEAAGVKRAKALVASVDSDADNVFVALSARRANPSLRIVARAESDESASKLELAGANRTLSPYAVGGRRLARLASHPLLVDYLDIVSGGERRARLHLEELDVNEDSAIANRTIADLRAVEQVGPRILALRHADDRFDVSPSDDEPIRVGDTLIVLGTDEQIARVEEVIPE